MHRITVLLLLIAFALQSFQGNILIIDYYTNTASFSKYCENKSRPQLHCKGKCLLMKKLAEKANEEQQNSSQKKHQFEVLFSESYFAKVSTNTFIKEKANAVSLSTSHTHSKGVFHPPAA